MSARPQTLERTSLRLAFRYDSHAPWLALPVDIAGDVAAPSRYRRPPGASLCLQGVIERDDGGVLPVFDLARWLGLAPLPDSRKHVLIVDAAAASAGIVCLGAPTTMRVELTEPGGRVTAALAPYVTPLGRVADGEVYEFDVCRWLRIFGHMPSDAGQAPPEVATLRNPAKMDGDALGGTGTMSRITAPVASIDQLIEAAERASLEALAAAQARPAATAHVTRAPSGA